MPSGPDVDVYRPYLKSTGSQPFTLVEKKLIEEKTFDWTLVLRINTYCSASGPLAHYAALCGLL